MTSNFRLHAALSVILFCVALPVVQAEEPPGKLKVFVLAGQSNMQGHGLIPADEKRNGGKGSLEFLARHPKTARQLSHTRDKQGQWLVRDDVWIWYLDRAGWLTAGYGAQKDRIGPEFQFGHVMGSHYREPVLLIKLAWGGKSIAQDFRSPSAGGETGEYYKRILRHTRAVLANLKQYFPGYDGRGYELLGIGWHQGWNDRVNQAYNDAYEQNLSCLIRDLRTGLGVSRLPFVIAETGMSGYSEKHPRALSLMRHQAA
ncbi:MAG: sialate O-acetylesterase, partial [Planctomycetaceae bacterium]